MATSILDTAAVRQAVLPISVDQYHRLGAAGIISENTELLRGVILEKMIKTPRHTWFVERLADWLRENLPAGFYVRQEQPLTLVDSEPEPDIAVVSGMRDDYQDAHPATARLVIEVAITSEGIDREKASLYADAGVSEYWIVLPGETIVERYREATSDGYASVERFKTMDSVTSLLLPDVRLELSSIFSRDG